MKLPRVYAILDTATVARRGLGVEAAAEALIEGGVRLLQLRHKEHFTEEMLRAAEHVARRARAAGAMLVIDDRVDIALLLDAGVHLGQTDLPAREARRLLGQGRWIGLSTHNEEQLRAAEAEPVDYLALGPIFTTASKRNPDPALGVEGLRRLRPLSRRPLVAIGGITRVNAAAVFGAGADSVAIVADLFGEPCDTADVRRNAAEWIELAGEPSMI